MTRRAWLFLGLLTGIAAAISLIGWPHTPRGLHQDELLTGYEGWSLAHTFRDQWGAFLPAYFLSWGSGQTVLASYLTIPFAALLGLNEYTIRLPELLAGIGIVPLVFFTVRKVYSQPVAWAAATLMASSLWRLQVSRWGVEANLLPFVLLLGIIAYHRGLATQRIWVRLTSLIPFSLAFYAYGTSIYVVPVLLAILCVRDWQKLRETPKQWAIAVVFFLFLATPMALAMVKNFLFNPAVLPGERFLPFSIPSLPESRLGQVSGQSKSENLTLFLRGFNDGLPWNSVGSHQNVSILLIFLALGTAVVELRRRQASTFTLWLIACLPLIVLIPLNTNRANVFIVPIIALAAKSAVELYRTAGRAKWRQAVLITSVFLLSVQTAWAITAYFSSDHQDRLAYAFLEGLVPAIKALPPGSEPVIIDPEVPLPYISVLYAEHTANSDFYPVNSIDRMKINRWTFAPVSLPPIFLFLTRRALSPSQASQCTPVKTVNMWIYYACKSE